MKLFYASSRYRSFLRTAQSYCAIIREKHELTDNPNEAQIVIVHGLPCDFEKMFRSGNVKRNKYVIGCYLWEASDLPEAFVPELKHVDEIWTCSMYCYHIFTHHHPKVILMPFVIERDFKCSEADREFVKQAISYDRDCIYFLTVARASDRRKNVHSLVAVFQRLRSAMPKARLIVKCIPEDGSPWFTDSAIIYLPLKLTHAQVSALYELADVYVSGHHSEGWGLTLSDAILCRKPVIATGYSGNLEFMRPQSSFLLSFKENHILPEDRSSLFHSGMKWAYPDEQDLEDKLLRLYQGVRTGLACDRVQQATLDIGKFSRPVVRDRLLERLEEILGTCG